MPVLFHMIGRGVVGEKLLRGENAFLPFTMN